MYIMKVMRTTFPYKLMPLHGELDLKIRFVFYSKIMN